MIISLFLARHRAATKDFTAEDAEGAENRRGKQSLMNDLPFHLSLRGCFEAALTKQSRIGCSSDRRLPRMPASKIPRNDTLGIGRRHPCKICLVKANLAGEFDIVSPNVEC